uniref:Plastocyanin-like domain-containing protein n=1 Tax=Timema shepardi TaxID=629360 RepID=A0A7R9B352_TIMSH|nr:unnamed protein product [Timema shepardi]
MQDPDSGNTTLTPLARFKMTRGKKYRWRLINSSSFVCQIQLFIEDHNMTIIATDGEPCEPRVVTTITSVPDRLLNSKNTIWNSRVTTGNGWIFADYEDTHDYVVVVPHEPTFYPPSYIHIPDIIDVALINIGLLTEDMTVLRKLDLDNNPILCELKTDIKYKIRGFKQTTATCDWDEFRQTLEENLPEIQDIESPDPACHSDLPSRRGTTKLCQPSTAIPLDAGVHPNRSFPALTPPLYSDINKETWPPDQPPPEATQADSRLLNNNCDVKPEDSKLKILPISPVKPFTGSPTIRAPPSPISLLSPDQKYLLHPQYTPPTTYTFYPTSLPFIYWVEPRYKLLVLKAVLHLNPLFDKLMAKSERNSMAIFDECVIQLMLSVITSITDQLCKSC